jgi:hypothetical protein
MGLVGSHVCPKITRNVDTTERIEVLKAVWFIYNILNLNFKFFTTESRNLVFAIGIFH